MKSTAFTNSFKNKTKSMSNNKLSRLVLCMSMFCLLWATKTEAAAMSGTYTICASGCNYSSMSAAVSDLKTNGVNGATVFNISDGTYTDSVSIPAITGSSTKNTITFQSASGDSSKVVIQNPSSKLYYSKNYVVEWAGCSYVTFSKITLQRTGTEVYAVVLNANYNYASHHNSVLNCALISSKSNATSSSAATICSTNGGGDSMNTFSNCLLANGGYSIYWLGKSGGVERGNIFNNNLIKDFYYMGVQMTYQKNLSFRNNQISSSATYTSQFGIYVSSLSEDCYFTGNTIYLANGYYGFYMANSGGYSGRSNVVANNMVSTGSTYGSYTAYVTNCPYTNFYFNSFNNYSPSTATCYGLYQGGASAASSEFMNNIIYVKASGSYAVAMYAATTFFPVSNYNNIYGGGTGMISYNGSFYSSVSSYASAAKKDSNSKSINPGFTSNSNLHITSAGAGLIGAGKSISSITTDIDGDTRASKPCIGADEAKIAGLDAGISSIDSPVRFSCSLGNSVYATLSSYGSTTLTSATINWVINGVSQTSVNWTGSMTAGNSVSLKLGAYSFSANTNYSIKVWVSNPNGGKDVDSTNDTSWIADIRSAMDGGYTLGGTGANFSDFTTAVAALTAYGMCGDITFNVAAGTFNEQVLIKNINNPNNKAIYIRGFGNGKNATVLQYQSSKKTSTTNYTMMVSGTQKVYINNMTMSDTGRNANQYSTILAYANANNLQVRNCELDGPIRPKAATTNTALVTNSVSKLNSYGIIFDDCIFHGGTYGINISSDTGVTVSNCVFDSMSKQALYTYAVYNLRFIANKVNIKNSNATGAIGLLYPKDFTISNNIINLDGNGNAISSQLGSKLTKNSLIANNMISVTGGSSTTVGGIYIEASNDIDIYHNSIMSDNGWSASYCVYIIANNSASVNFVDNNLYSTKNLIFNASKTYFNNLNYNNYYCGGSTFATGSIANFSAWKTSTGKEGNSLNLNPGFTSSTNLHISNTALIAGTPISGITTDIDGDTRSTTKPTIGADEIQKVVLPKADFTFSPDSQCYPVTVSFTNNSTNAKTYSWSFGNGNTSTSTSPNTSYTAGGSYTVKLVATDSLGKQDSITKTVYVLNSQVPTAKFSGTNSCLGGTINFTDSSLGSPASYYWDFDDGGSSTVQSPSHQYTSAGTFNVTLKVTASGGCFDAISHSVTVYDLPTPSFTNSGQCFGDSTRFTDASTSGSGTITSWSWKFGDGGTSTAQNPIHLYASAGNYDVVLTTTSSLGCVDSTSASIQVFAKPSVSISRTANTLTAVTSSGLHYYSWYKNGSLEASNVGGSSSITPSGDGSYTLSIIDSNGCSNTSSALSVSVLDTIVGTITTSTGAALKNTNVYLVVYSAKDTTINAIDSTKTNSNGEYSFLTNDSFVYVIATPDSASYPHELATYYDSGLVIQDAVKIPVVYSSITADFSTIYGSNKGGGGFLGGKVTYCMACKQGAGGTPVVGIKIILMDGNDNPQMTTFTDKDGDFSFPNLALDKYKIWVDYPLVDNKKAPVITLTNSIPVRSNLVFNLHPEYLEMITDLSIVTHEKTAFQLAAYPNPFSANTNIQFNLPKTTEVTLSVTDFTGKETVLMSNKQLKSGNHTFNFDAGNAQLSKGIYLLKLTTPNGSSVLKLALLN